MNISEAQERCGLPAKTLRYYEDIALVVPDRRANGYRSYSERHVHQLRFLQQARSLGFSVDDCWRLLELYTNHKRSSADVKVVARARIAEIDRKLREMREMRNTLAELADSCNGDERPDCPILDDLANPTRALRSRVSKTTDDPPPRGHRAASVVPPLRSAST